MRYMTFTILSLTAAAAFVPGGARADTKVDVQQARSNALAGGPLNRQDAELLRRYGCESGTGSGYCDSLRYGNTGPYYRRYGYRRYYGWRPPY